MSEPDRASYDWEAFDRKRALMYLDDRCAYCQQSLEMYGSSLDHVRCYHHRHRHLMLAGLAAGGAGGWNYRS